MYTCCVHIGPICMQHVYIAYWLHFGCVHEPQKVPNMYATCVHCILGTFWLCTLAVYISPKSTQYVRNMCTLHIGYILAVYISPKKYPICRQQLYIVHWVHFWLCILAVHTSPRSTRYVRTMCTVQYWVNFGCVH